jgi:hypothetical protein
MARVQKIVCDSCGSLRIAAGSPFCGACGRPTVWATHQERTEWEVQQWRKARTGPLAEPGTIVALPRKPVPPPAPVTQDWDGFLTPADPMPSNARPARERRDGAGLAAILKRALAGLRRIFGTSAMVPLDPKPTLVPEEQTVAVVREQAPKPEAPPRMALVPAVPEERVAEPPQSEAKPPALTRNAPPKPRKRPAPPTNKDMLKQTLSVLTKVERRLEQLEQEVAGIDDAVRKVSSSGEEQAAVGE